MAGIKRDTAAAAAAPAKSKREKSGKKSSKGDSAQAVKPVKKSKKVAKDVEESGNSEQENGYTGFSADSDVDMADGSSKEQPTSKPPKRKAEDEPAEKKKKSKYETPKEISSKLADMHGTQPILLHARERRLIQPPASNSREAHAKQKALAKERKNAKPNADVIERSKKLWEKLRLKSHVDKEERKELVKELFEIVTGRVKDFVFKHDSVRVIQTAIKYSTMEQRRMIARELKGEFKVLSEGKYSKFLIAKLVEKG